MLSELFQLDEPPQEDGEESLRAGGSEDSYSDDDREEDEEEEEDPSDGSDENGSHSKQDDRKAIAVIRSVGELSVPEKYKSTHQIRVSSFFAKVTLSTARLLCVYCIVFYHTYSHSKGGTTDQT